MANGHTVAVYNGVAFRNVLLRQYEETFVYDDSDTDIVYTRIAIRFAGIVHGDTARDTSYTAGRGITTTPNPGGGATEHKRALQAKLEEPGRDFKLSFGVKEGASPDPGSVLLDVIGAASRQDIRVPSRYLTGYDVNNGPKPRILSLERVFGDASFWVEFALDVHVVQCDGNENESGVLNNKWSVADTIDANFFTTRVWQGKLRLAYPEAHDFRALTLPPLTPGMRRDSMSFESSPDGLTLAYRVVDQEVTWAPPAPATKWAFSHTNSYVENGAKMIVRARVVLEGAPDVNKIELAALAISILIAQAAPRLAAGNNDSEIVQQLDITNDLTDQVNRIAADIVVLRAPGEGALNQLLQTAAIVSGRDLNAKFLEDANFPGDYERSANPQGRDGEFLQSSGPIVGVDSIVSLQGYLQSPCSPRHSITGIDFDPGGETAEDPGNEIRGVLPEYLEPPEIAVVPDLQYDDVEYSAAHLEGLITYWEMESEYQTREHTLMMPRAAEYEPGGGPQPDSAAFVSIAPPTTRRVMRMIGERAGSYPQFPSPVEFTDENGIAHHPLGRRVLTESQDRDAIGLTQVFRAEAEYAYGLSRTPTADEKLRVGVTPWLETPSLSDSVEDASDLYTGTTA